jgi:6-pyruvoyl-tetrahydropterin synthase
MYSVTVRDHVLLAHSLKKKVFGPAAQLHGATYVVDAEFRSPELDESNIVIDIALASQVLKEVLSKINFQNLDEMKEFQGHITTTEFMAKFIHDEINQKISSLFKGILKITLHESHVAWASYEGQIGV